MFAVDESAGVVFSCESDQCVRSRELDFCQLLKLGPRARRGSLRHTSPAQKCVPVRGLRCLALSSAPWSTAGVSHNCLGLFSGGLSVFFL